MVDIHTYAYNEAVRADLSPTELSSVISCESGWQSDALGDHGTSYGIAQIHLVAHETITKEEALDPYWSVDWMVGEWKAGRESEWSCFNQLFK